MRFAIIALTVLSLFLFSSAIIIDSFDATDDSPGLLCDVPDPTIVGGVPNYPENICFTQLHSRNVIGGEADVIIKNLAHVGAGTQDSIVSFENNVLGWSVPPAVPAVLEVHWDGAGNFDPANPYTIVYNGLGGLDLTDEGAAQGILFRTESSDLAVPLTFSFYTSATEVSQYRIDQSAIIAGRNTTYLAIPFANFFQAPFATTGPADFTNIGAVTFNIDTPSGGSAPSVDVSVTTISTVNLLTTTKTDEVLASVDMVANPGEIIKYTIDITNEVDLLGLDLNGTYLFDNPSALSPYLTLVAGSVVVRTVDDTGATIANPATLQIFNGNNAGDTTVAIYFGNLRDGYHFYTTFNVTVGNLPCVHPTCAYPDTIPGLTLGCQVTGQEGLGGGRCLCSRNQGAACFNIPANANFPSLPPLFVNFTDSIVKQNCKRTNDPATTTAPADSTRTPVWALPDPAITKTLVDGSQSSGVAPGATVAWQLDIVNNFRRQSSAVNLCDEVPAGTTYTSTGSSAGWLDENGANPCSETSTKCCMDIGAFNALETKTFTFAVVVDASLPCATASLTSEATITTSGTDCPETDLTNNADSLTVPITGGVDLSITKTANPSPATIGTDSVIVYTITYVNNGVRDAEGAVVTESVPAGYTFNATLSSAQWTSAGANSYTASVGSVPRGVPNSLTFAINLPAFIDCPTTEVVNTVSITENCGDIDDSNNEATATVPLIAVPNLALTMTRNGDFTPGATVCYTLSYTNIGTRVATDSTITNAVPASTVYATTGSSAFSCAAGDAAGTSCTLNVGSVNPGASGEATFCVTADSNLPCGSSITNPASIATTCNEVDLSNNDASNTGPVDGSPSLTLTKTASAGTIALGDVIVYTLAYSNIGSIEATSVTITENLPAGTSFAADQSSAGWTASGSSYSLSVPNVAPGASGSATFALTLNGPTFVGCTLAVINNTASITESCGGASTTASATIQPVAAADLYVNANDSAPVVLKNTQTATVPLVFGNLGVLSGRNVVITATVPQYATAVPDSNFVLEGSNLVNRRDSVAGLTGNQPLSLVYTVTRPLPCGVDNLPVTITISTDCNEVTTTNNEVTVNIPIIALPDLVVTKDDNTDEPVRVGGQIDYTITYWNAGYRHATNVVLTDTYSEHVTPISSAGWTCDTATRVCTFSHGAADVVIGDGPFTTSFSVTVGENLNSQTIIHNHVEVTNDCGEDAPADNEDNEETPVVGNPDLVVHKTDNGFEARPGDVITYTITYENIGDSAAPDTVITELVPVFSKFVAALSSPGWDCPDGSGAGTPCRMNVGTVNRGATPAPLLFAVKTNEWLRCGIDTIDNCVNIKTTNDTIELLYTNNRDTEQTPILACPNLIVTVTDNLNDRARHSRLRVGERVIYNISYTNCGNREGVNAQLIESVPAWTTFSAENSTAGWNCTTGAPAGTVCVLELGDLIPGTEGWVTFAVDVADFPVEVKSTRDEVCIVNDCGECDPTNNCDHDFTPLFGVPDLKIDETAECRSIEWYVEWTNIGDQTANNVVITDTLPAGTIYDADNSDDWTCSGAGTCTYDVGDVRPGKGGHLILTTNPINGTSGIFTNVVTIDGTGRPGIADPTPENNRDEAVVGFDGCPISCDSCCPEEEACCPDKTEVVFNFGGILDGVSQCQAEP